jgi:hypothetical protein
MNKEDGSKEAFPPNRPTSDPAMAAYVSLRRNEKRKSSNALPCGKKPRTIPIARQTVPKDGIKVKIPETRGCAMAEKYQAGTAEISQRTLELCRITEA